MAVMLKGKLQILFTMSIPLPEFALDLREELPVWKQVSAPTQTHCQQGLTTLGKRRGLGSSSPPASEDSGFPTSREVL